MAQPVSPEVLSPAVAGAVSAGQPGATQLTSVCRTRYYPGAVILLHRNQDTS